MPLRIGIVDLCTSHPQKFVPILRELGAQVVAVWDSADTRDAGFVDGFAQRFEIPTVCASLEEMVPLVDAVMIHSADWDRHVERALPFVEAGKAVCIDKPVVGSVKDVRRLIALDRKSPGLIFGGSSCVFAPEVVALRHQLAGDPIVAGLASGPNDLFSYGVHTIEMLEAVMGHDARAVTCLEVGPLGNYAVRFGSGAIGHLHMHTPGHAWFLMAHGQEHGVLSTGIDAGGLYPAFITRFLDFVAGNNNDGWNLPDAVEPDLVAVAMDKASRIPGSTIRLDELEPDDGIDGAAFARRYREARDRGENLYTLERDERWAAARAATAGAA